MVQCWIESGARTKTNRLSKVKIHYANVVTDGKVLTTESNIEARPRLSRILVLASPSVVVAMNRSFVP